MQRLTRTQSLKHSGLLLWGRAALLRLQSEASRLVFPMGAFRWVVPVPCLTPVVGTSVGDHFYKVTNGVYGFYSNDEILTKGWVITQKPGFDIQGPLWISPLLPSFPNSFLEPGGPSDRDIYIDSRKAFLVINRIGISATVWYSWMVSFVQKFLLCACYVLVLCTGI